MLNWMPLLSYAVVAIFTPGPNNIMAMSIAGQYGIKSVQRFILGAMSGFGLILLLSAVANVLLYRIMPQIQLVMSIVGALYLGYLAYKVLMGGSHKAQEASPTGETAQPPAVISFFGGMGLQFLNVKGILFSLTLMGTFVIPFDPAPYTIALIAVGLPLIGCVATNAWAAFGALFQRFLARYQTPFNIVMAGLLVYCAVSIFIH